MNGTYILETRNLTKTFPGVTALENVNLKVRRGEIHGLCGENGAGKSTLIKILSGIYPGGMYEGDVLIDGRNVSFRNVKDAEQAGIAAIYQEFSLVKELSIAENIFLGNLPCTSLGIIDYNFLYQECFETLKQVGIEEDPGEKVKNLGVGQQQLVEIAKALSRNARLLILDEPTAALTDREIMNLMGILRRLREEGVTCIYISHKVSEILDIADTVTVLRDGRLVGTEPVAEITREGLVEMMVGRAIDQVYPKRCVRHGDVVLQVKDFSVYDSRGKCVIDDVSFDVHEGEVLGFFGLVGAGRTELFTSIFGAFPGKCKGDIYLGSERIDIRSPHDAISNGIYLVTEDRKRFGLFLQACVYENITITSLDEISHFYIVDRNKEISKSNDLVSQLSIKTPSLDAIVRNLSGGNQQKIILARGLMVKPEVFILDEPTRGIDVGAKYEIYKIINDLAEAGAAVIIISSELPEIMGICDRVITMCHGRITGQEFTSEADSKTILEWALGGKQEYVKTV